LRHDDDPQNALFGRVAVLAVCCHSGSTDHI
jgi:hypothetical protein